MKGHQQVTKTKACYWLQPLPVTLHRQTVDEWMENHLLSPTTPYPVSISLLTQFHTQLIRAAEITFHIIFCSKTTSYFIKSSLTAELVYFFCYCWTNPVNFGFIFIFWLILVVI